MELDAVKDVQLGIESDPVPPGYRMVSIAELREGYGTWIGNSNIGMPLAHYISMSMDVVKVMTGYKGVHVCQYPSDMWVFQEIIHERQPNVIIEIGNQVGGSTMFLRDTLFSCVPDALCVFGIDIDRTPLSDVAKNYPDIVWLTGDACELAEGVCESITSGERVMVIDDSAHDYNNTTNVLNAYSDIVTKGQYFIVEDTILGQIVPCRPDQEGAHRAVMDFVDLNKDFRIDRQREKWFVTMNPQGFLEKIR